MIKENKGTLICVSFCDEDTQFGSESFHIGSDEKVSRDDVIEKLASYMQGYEDETGVGVIWATVIVIPLSDAKETWRMEYICGETSQDKVLQ